MSDEPAINQIEISEEVLDLDTFETFKDAREAMNKFTPVKTEQGTISSPSVEAWNMYAAMDNPVGTAEHPMLLDTKIPEDVLAKILK